MRSELMSLAGVLDQQLLDRERRPMGMVDGLTIEVREGEPPRVADILVGGTTLGERLAGPVGWALRAAARRWGARQGAPTRIPWSAVRDVGVDVEVDVDARQTSTLHWEDWMRRHLIGRIPGA